MVVDELAVEKAFKQVEDLLGQVRDNLAIIKAKCRIPKVKDESWQGEGITLAQKGFLTRHNLPFHAGTTKGEASDLIREEVAKWDKKQ